MDEMLCKTRPKLLKAHRNYIISLDRSRSSPLGALEKYGRTKGTIEPLLHACFCTLCGLVIRLIEIWKMLVPDARSYRELFVRAVNAERFAHRAR